eukprot:1189309-Prorocentrum_minimum.AAC.2
MTDQSGRCYDDYSAPYQEDLVKHKDLENGGGDGGKVRDGEEDPVLGVGQVELVARRVHLRHRLEKRADAAGDHRHREGHRDGQHFEEEHLTTTTNSANARPQVPTS